MKYCVIIPARYNSSRLPGKPLVEINGVPMLLRTYNQCIKACDPELVYVATDDMRIVDLCEANEIQYIYTSEECLTGTDRVAECVDKINAEVFINVQGDEPLTNPEDLKKIIRISTENPNKIFSGYCEIKENEMFFSESTPKVVFSNSKKLMYMSRAAIPSNKNKKFIKGYRQVCIYAFPKNELIKFAEFGQKSHFEEIEDIEILRFLEMDVEVEMVEMSDFSIAVDNPEDIIKVSKLLDLQGEVYESRKV